MTQHRQKQAQPPTPIPSGQREFGDWRVDTDGKPTEPQSLNMWQHTYRRLSQLENATSYGALWSYSVSVTYTPEQTANGESNETDSDIVPIYGSKRIIRLLIAVFLLLPLSITMVYALALQTYHSLPAKAANVGFWLSEPIYFSLLGIFTFVALIIAQFATPILMYFYVLGHELTHALAALTCFGKISTVSVDLCGGYIETDKDNAYIALAPYFVPLWMLVWVLFAWIVGFFVPEESITPWFFGGGGFWWCFHIYWTIWVIPREQPDILENGITFSLLIVIIANIAGLILLLRFFNFISLSGYWQDFQTCAGKLAETISWLFSLCVG